MSAEISAALDTLAGDVALDPVDRTDTLDVVSRVECLLARWGVRLDADRRLALTAHSLAFARRVREGEALPELDPALFDEVPADVRAALHEVLGPYCAERGADLRPEEVLLFATHVELARTPS